MGTPMDDLNHNMTLIGQLGSTFIEFDDVRVPVDNLIGKENKGFPLIMSSEYVLRERYPGTDVVKTSTPSVLRLHAPLCGWLVSAQKMPSTTQCSERPSARLLFKDRQYNPRSSSSAS